MLIAISAMHGRHALSRCWAEHTASLGFDEVVVAVDGSDEDMTCTDAASVEICAVSGFRWVKQPNDPLAGKFNAALRKAIDLGATRIMVAPSDDFISPAWVKAARESEEHYMYPHCCGVVDAATQQAYVIRKISFGTLKYGAGRVVSRAVVDACQGELWPPLENKGLDGASHRRIEKAGFKVKIVETEGIPITDVKTKDNLWPWQTWKDSGVPSSMDECLHMVSPSVREQINAMKA